jgi:hypothetical protein
VAVVTVLVVGPVEDLQVFMRHMGRLGVAGTATTSESGTVATVVVPDSLASIVARYFAEPPTITPALSPLRST